MTKLSDYPDGRSPTCPTSPAVEAANELLAMLKEARDHLEYCGYGDKWERECAGDLRERLDATIEKYEGLERGRSSSTPESAPDAGQTNPGHPQG